MNTFDVIVRGATVLMGVVFIAAWFVRDLRMWLAARRERTKRAR